MNEILTNILNALIPTLLTALTGFFIWIGTTVKNKYHQKMNNELINDIVCKSIKYVEQKLFDLSNDEKFKEATSMAIKWLKSKGIELSESEIEWHIESLLKDSKGGK